jgi:uncharacterized membrane protein YozB (DUF420 family)
MVKQWVRELSGIFGTSASLMNDLTLLIQIVSFVLVLGAMAYKVKKKWKIHGFIMGAALVLHFINFLMAMLPSFMLHFSLYATGTSYLFVQTLWIHAISGGLVLVLGFFIMIPWIPKPSSLKHCFRRKRLMDATVLLWAVSLAFGIATYIALYT